MPNTMPTLSDTQLQQLLDMQFHRAMSGSEALLIHLGLTHGQVKAEKIIHEASPVIPLSYDEVLELLAQRKSDGAVITGECVVINENKDRQLLTANVEMNSHTDKQNGDVESDKVKTPCEGMVGVADAGRLPDKSHELNYYSSPITNAAALKVLKKKNKQKMLALSTMSNDAMNAHNEMVRQKIEAEWAEVLASRLHPDGSFGRQRVDVGGK